MIKLSPITKGLLFGFIILLVSLGSGMIGFKYFCPITWHDAFLNAAMLLTGMGPVDEPTSNAGKVFAGVYALYSGIVFLSLVGIMTIPIFHRYVHMLNISHPFDEEVNSETNKKVN
ncbi:MAG: hypothetical protein OJF59_001778 [Cytophagales bacterium]|jgi:hypothetical protein|nr:hypothetical protein [Bacteroidota bacterium]MBS1950746.1 hypothetical protein [Bacteroidota bacterium]MBS1980694.1 hypothetical protein [Bacteroidota bacterium]WHZ08025.1 MAG: hypothetical protein OJF59_001778 [Cytophagales bacterium]